MDVSTRAKVARKQVARELKKLTKEETKAIVEDLSEEVEAKIANEPQGRRPGMTIGTDKVAWTVKDIRDLKDEHGNQQFPDVTFIPERTIPLTWNGIRVQAIAGRELKVPKCFKDIYDRSIRVSIEAPQEDERALKERGYEAIARAGAGALEEE